MASLAGAEVSYEDLFEVIDRDPDGRQGLTLGHPSAQLKRLLCDRGCS